MYYSIYFYNIQMIFLFLYCCKFQVNECKLNFFSNLIYNIFIITVDSWDSRKMESILRYLRYILKFAIFFISNVYVIPCYLVVMTILLPLRFYKQTSPLYWKIEDTLFRMMQSIVVSWIDSGGYKGKLILFIGNGWGWWS